MNNTIPCRPTSQKQLWPTLICRPGLAILILSSALLILETGCRTTKHKSPNPSAANVTASSDSDLQIVKSTPPQIYSIGETAVLKYEANKELPIPISGAYLFQKSFNWSIRVDGVVPAIRGQDYDLRTLADNPLDSAVGAANAEIVFSANYTSKLHDGDTLTVNADIVQNSDADIRQTLQTMLDIEGSITNAVLKTNVTDFNSALANINGNKNKLMDIMPSSIVPKSSKLVTDAFQNFKPQIASPDEINGQIGSLKLLQAKLSQGRQTMTQEYLSQAKSPILASGFRTFQMYSSEGYRSKFLNTRFGLNEIKAYPLPDVQIEEMFGNKVREHFYVVAFCAQNNSSQDRLINIGMLNAYGRAIVYPANNPTATFTIPIQVPPESMQMVYSDVAQTKWGRPREWIFRSLEFAGGLGTAIATGFNGTPSLIKALGVYTGVGIPALKQLWPDQIPNYLGYIVSFGMPDLVKVPQNGGNSGWKLLFFSKDNINSMIADPAMFGRLNVWNPKMGLESEPFKKPQTYVVYLSFDTLEVPFELSVPSTNNIPLAVTIQPPSQQANANTQAAFVANVTGGTSPFTYQWLLNGNVELQNGANISGATDVKLNFLNLTTNNNGTYSVRVIDSNGRIIKSADASLQIH